MNVIISQGRRTAAGQSRPGGCQRGVCYITADAVTSDHRNKRGVCHVCSPLDRRQAMPI